MPRILTPQLESDLCNALSIAPAALSLRAVAGGSIHRSGLLFAEDASQPLAFLKLNGAGQAALFEAEMDALEVFRHAHVVSVPRPIHHGVCGAHSWLLLEPLAMRSVSSSAAEVLGQQLALLHQIASADTRYGWAKDNFIGSTPQTNTWSDDWAAFFCNQRLRPQFEMAARNGHIFPQMDRVFDQALILLKDHRPLSSLLHGDLWAGNVGCVSDSQPVIFDPASYFGDRETDLAFTRMFGGFPDSFYQAYQTAWPLPAGADERSLLYNLYHVLNHLNLFGEPYGRQARHCIGEILAS